MSRSVGYLTRYNDRRVTRSVSSRYSEVEVMADSVGSLGHSRVRAVDLKPPLAYRPISAYMVTGSLYIYNSYVKIISPLK